MRLMHLADLHIGKRVNGYSMIDDQRYILDQILSLAEANGVDGFLIAGDVYDTPVPTNEAVSLFDDFLTKLFLLKKVVFIISGNHDSSEKLAFGSKIFNRSGVHISPCYSPENKVIAPVTLHDTEVDVDVWMIPFVRSADVKHAWPEEAESISTYTDAMRVLVSHLNFVEGHRNIALVHQFITSAEPCDSEDLSVGTLDNIDADVFDPFDYVALGHLHGPQYIKRETVRYAGSPLKYSFSEVDHEKSVTIVDVGKEIKIRTIPLIPKRDLVRIKGTFDELISHEMRDKYLQNGHEEDYFEITLTDTQRVENAASALREYYKKWMCLNYESRLGNTEALFHTPEKKKTPIEYIQSLCNAQYGRSLNEDETKIINELFETLKIDDA